MRLLIVNPNISDSVSALIQAEAQRSASSAVRHAESLVALAPGKAGRGSFVAPPVKPHRGLPDPIARLLDGPKPAGG